jgi:D-3-phosphoglycerate dehydrogenase
VIAVTRRGHDVPGAARTLPADRLDEIWGAADHFVIAAPATSATRHLVGAAELAKMRSHAWIVNIARGSLIDTDALVAALRERRIGGAALDVTDPEPLPADHPLVAMDNCLVVPHIASASRATRGRMAAMAAANLLAGVRGERLPTPVNPEIYDR